jgi:hypothetical protein
MMASLDTEEFAHGWGGKRFTPIDDGAFYGDGRGSALCYMWIIQFTRQNWSGFLEYLEGLSWPRPESVQVLLRDQDDDCFGLWMIYKGKLKEVHLPGRRESRACGIPNISNARIGRPEASGTFQVNAPSPEGGIFASPRWLSGLCLRSRDRDPDHSHSRSRPLGLLEPSVGRTENGHRALRPPRQDRRGT